MGLLTDPNSGEGIFTHSLLRYSNKMSFLLYFVALAWFTLLAHDEINMGMLELLSLILLLVFQCVENKLTIWQTRMGCVRVNGS